jgi:hypothetical protein
MKKGRKKRESTVQGVSKCKMAENKVKNFAVGVNIAISEGGETFKVLSIYCS